MLNKLIFVSILFTSFSYSFINIEPPVIGEKEGLSGETSISAQFNSGNTDSSTVGLAGKAEYNQKSWLAYLIASYTYGETNSEENANEGLAHLRYVHNIKNTAFDYELFLQGEFNKFQSIERRNLAGANVRRKFDISFDKFYLGLGLFYSYTKPDTVSDIDPIYKRTRMNSYVSFLKKINENLSIAYLGYYQPNIELFSDYRVSQIVQLNTSITNDLILGVDINHAYNATPYSGVEKNDIRSTVNLRYKFR